MKVQILFMSVKMAYLLIVAVTVSFTFGYIGGSSNTTYSNTSSIKGVSSEIDRLNQIIYQLESDVDDYQQELSSLKRQLDLIDEVHVKQHYEWSYGNSDWSWDLSIPLSLYLEYRSRSRPDSLDNYVYLALDSGDDYYIESIVGALQRAATNKGFNKYETVEYAISFVQSLPYTEDNVETDWDEYPRYPIETLFDRGGDCEDTSILVAALLFEMNYDVSIIILENEQHCAIGVSGGEGIYGSYYLVNGIKYFYLETTGEGWDIGEIPSNYAGTSAKIYPLKDK